MVFERCFICKSEKNDPVKYGKILENDRMAVHYYCLLLTSNLVQNGRNDNEGFLGFLPSDIEKEVKRIKSLVCYICNGKQANIGCCGKKCRKTFHTTCGIDYGCLSEFRDTFRSFCDQHVVIGDRAKHSREELCIICSDDMGSYDRIESIRPPCCKNGWFHKYCLAKYALTSASLTKCLLCNNTNRFKQIECRGIFIPEQDAAWEREPNAFVELLQRPNSCSAAECQCPDGRDVDSEDWDLKICDTCGSVSMHIQCMEDKTAKRFTCEPCAIIAVKYPPLPDEEPEENRPSSRSSNSSASSYSFGRRRIRRMSLFSSANPKKPQNCVYPSSSSSTASTSTSSSSSSSRNRGRPSTDRMSTDSNSSDLVINPANFTRKRKNIVSFISTGTESSLNKNRKERRSGGSVSSSRTVSPISVSSTSSFASNMSSMSSASVSNMSSISSPCSSNKSRGWPRGRKRKYSLDSIPKSLSSKASPVVLLQKLSPTMIDWYMSGAAYKIPKKSSFKELSDFESCKNYPSIELKVETFTKPIPMVKVEIEKEGFEFKPQIEKDDFEKDDFENDISTMVDESFGKCNPVDIIIAKEKANVQTVKSEFLSPKVENTVSAMISHNNEFNLLKSIKEEYDSKPLPFIFPKIEPKSPSKRESMIILRYESSKSLKRKVLSDCEVDSPNFKKPRNEIKVEPKMENEENSTSDSPNCSQLQSTLYNFIKSSPGKENPMFLSPQDDTKRSHIRSIIKKKSSPIVNGQRSLLNYFSKM